MPRTSKEAKSQENREHKIADLEKRVRDLVSYNPLTKLGYIMKFML